MSAVADTLPRMYDDEDELDEPSLPTISAILDPWFHGELERLKGLRRDRVARVQVRLNEHIETRCDALLTAPERVLVGLQRDAEPQRAVATTVTSDALPGMLASFTDEAFLPADAQDRRVQLSIIAKLCRRMLEPRFTGVYWSSCELFDVESRVRALGGPKVEYPVSRSWWLRY